MIFPRWDVIVIILSVFLLTYCYIEAKSNYHRGSILILRWVSFWLEGLEVRTDLVLHSYLVLVCGFFFAPQDKEDEIDPATVSTFTSAPLSFLTSFFYSR